MSPLKLTPELLEAIQRDLTGSMADDADLATEVSADGLVTIQMDARFSVTQVSITGTSLSTKDLTDLEHATRSCVNSAIQEVARRNGDRLAESVQRLGNPGSS